MPDVIAVLDFGSQYTQVIARRVREAKVYSRVYRYDTPAERLRVDGVRGLILSGGPSSVFSRKAPLPDRGIFELGLPVLGICYGIQLLGHLLGGQVEKSREREYGRGTLRVTRPGRLFENIPSEFQVWNSHGDKLTRLPPGFEAIAETENTAFAAIEDRQRNFYGIQFHPEVAHTEYGVTILRNFLLGICGCSGDWTPARFVDSAVARIREQVGKSRVILGLSGGVDSSVAAALIHKAIGRQLTCVFVDNGLLRKAEARYVESLFRRNFRMDLRVVDASDLFLNRLRSVADPERKRKIIGRTFVEVFEGSLKKLGAKAEFLAQGTLYPDVIESESIGNNPAAVIKSHHNVGGLPKRMKFRLLEPLRELFKDEVRAVGRELDLPDEIVWRHPFPGPGLGVRCLGAVTRERLDVLREADAILEEEMRSSGWYAKVWQAFCVFLPVRTVGVMGDERTYDYVIAVRVVESEDAMTADWVRLPGEVLQRISSRIINEVRGVNRVVYDISSKPPATIEWE